MNANSSKDKAVAPILFGIIYRQTWAIFKKGFWLFLLLGVAAQCCMLLISLINKTGLYHWGLFLLMVLLGILVGIIGKAWIISIAYGITKSNKKVSLSQINCFGNISILSVVGAAILAAMLNLLGGILLFIPGIIFYFLNYLYLPVIVCEKASAWNSIKRSWQLMKIHFFKASWIIFCFRLVTLALLVPFIHITYHYHSTALIFGASIFKIFIGALILAFDSVLSLILFLELKQLQSDQTALSS